MRVKLQLVICNDEGHEETVTDVITLTKNQRRIEHLGDFCTIPRTGALADVSEVKRNRDLG